MQGNDIQVLRLDYTREPPGYMVGASGDFQSEGYVWWTGIALPPDSASDDEAGLVVAWPSEVASGFKTQDAALTAAWVDYRARNDPPGMKVRGEGGTKKNAKRRRPARWRIYTAGAAGSYRETQGLARLEAWGRYDRRLALREKLNNGVQWPEMLGWSDDQVTEVERWIIDSTAEMPEVLRG